ncbi:unnamed protein product [Ostreobium quekettii]|uniref:BTB domain-containing protein n=1 Tax=Ostreobium quekettii TaxID=121088 RepID=A0A8S1IWN2_9CHLO|nr:unnamed protein product [Ostreobium quekettii]|eukprot:evm.model.scf_1640.1 EVM.evm.TU.scf_1640.1   scf_1640:21997-26587(+)
MSRGPGGWGPGGELPGLRKCFKRKAPDSAASLADDIDAPSVMEACHLISVLHKAKEQPGKGVDGCAVRRATHGLAELCKSEVNVETVVSEGGIEALVPYLVLVPETLDRPDELWTGWSADEAAKEACFILGLLATKTEFQQRIADSGTLAELIALLKLHQSSPPPGSLHNPIKSAGVARRAADAITNLAHENVYVKNLVRQMGGIPPLVALLESWDVKVQRAAAGALRTLAFKTEENKAQIVQHGALELLIRMLTSEEAGVHYEAVGVIGNLVHSSGHIKRQVLQAGALQPVIGLLSSPCNESQREAALLLGQFATADPDYKVKIVQRGAVPPLINMLSSNDTQLREMAAFALGRLAQNADNQAGILHSCGLKPLLELLESRNSSLQHNAAFALYGLADNEDNICEIIKEGGYSRLINADLIVQASKDCVQKTMKRLEEKLHGRVLGQLLYQMRSPLPLIQQRIASSLARLAPSNYFKLIFLEHKGLDILLDMLIQGQEGTHVSSEAASSLFELATKIRNTAPMDATPDQPAKSVYLGEQYVNNPTLADVTFIVEGRKFYAHRIALLASSDAFRAMFNSGYKEKEARHIEIPNIGWPVFEAMMQYTYTGQVEVPEDIAQELLRAADQYLLEGLKRLCEEAISDSINVENLERIYTLSEAYSAPQLGIRCVLFALEHCDQVVAHVGQAEYLVLMGRMVPQLKSSLTDQLLASEEEAQMAETPDQ